MEGRVSMVMDPGEGCLERYRLATGDGNFISPTERLTERQLILVGELPENSLICVF